MCPWKNGRTSTSTILLPSTGICFRSTWRCCAGARPSNSPCIPTCTRQKETIHVEPRKVVIIEGILALSDRRLCKQMDLRIFVDADPDERLIRVIQRDVIERGRTAEAVMDRYVRVLKPMHLEFIEPAKRIADLIIPQGGHNEKAIEILKMYIEKIVDR